MPNKPFRVLHIVSVMNYGGIENLLMNIYRNINRNKIQFDFLVTREEKGIFDEEIKELGGEIYNIPHVSKKGYFKYKKIADEFFEEKKDEYKIIHCHMNTWAGFFLPLAKKNNIPIRIAHSHTSDIRMTLKNFPKFLIKTYHSLFINSNSTHFFACSKKAGEWLFDKNIKKNKINLINNGINVEKFIYDENIALKKRKELNINKDQFVIGHVGNFSYAKNYQFLIDIFHIIHKKDSSAVLCLVGSGKLEKEVKKKVKKLNIEENVKFLGLRNDVNQLLMSFDVFLFPSRFEGLPVTLIEAQAAGSKIIASDTITKEVKITDLIQFISLNESSENWADNVLDLKNSDYDRNYYQEIVNAGYDIKNTAEELQNFYINEYNKISE